MRILIAEDEMISRRILEAALVRWGHEVVVTRDGEQAWAVLQSAGSPFVAILDVTMPGFDGITLCRMTRRLPAPRYIILLTGKNSEEEAAAGLEAGADDYLSKPLDNEELKKSLEKSLLASGRANDPFAL